MAPKSRQRTRTSIIETDEDVARGVRALSRKCPTIRALYKRTGPPPLRRRKPGLTGLARIVVGQQVSVASANAIWARCEEHIVPLTASRLSQLSDEEFRACGLSRPKIRTLRAIANSILEGTLDLENAGVQDEAELNAKLLAVSGIGPWTANVFSLFCVGHADAFPPGDLAIQVAAQDALELDHRPTADELEALAERWRPWRAVAARLLWAHYALLKDGRSGISV